MLFVKVQHKTSKAPPQQFQFAKEEIIIGRLQSNDVVLPKGNISKSHAKLFYRNGKVQIADLQSTNKTWINGQAIPASQPHVVGAQDRVFIGDFMLEVSTQAPPGQAQQDAKSAMPKPQPPPPLPPKPQVPAPAAAANGAARAHTPKPPPVQAGPPVLPPIHHHGKANGTAQAPLVPTPGPQGTNHPPPPNHQWHTVNMVQGPQYFYTPIPQGWLLLSPAGQMVFIEDNLHQKRPLPLPIQ